MKSFQNSFDNVTKCNKQKLPFLLAITKVAVLFTE